jgi:hypothetical protein
MKLRTLICCVVSFFATTLFAATPTAAVNEGPPLPIWAWHGVPAVDATPERFQELADAGFTLSFNGAPDAATQTKMLDAAHKAGVQLLISLPELQTAPEVTARQFKAHPALAGYYLRDEPPAGAFAELGAWTKRIQSVDDMHPCYVNLLPTYGNPGMWETPDYQTYVDRFIAEVPTPMLSFDHYPIRRTGADPSTDVVNPDFYQNLEICSAAARNANRQLQAFALLVAHNPYPIPTIEHLRLQAYSDLAYGAQVLQYFTYWTPVSDVWNFHEAPIAVDGKRTPTYDLVKTFNAELQAVRGVFVGSHVESLGHTGDLLPAGTTRYDSIAPVKTLFTTGQGVVASHLAKENQRYLVLVNRDVQQPTMATVEFDGSRQVQQIAKDGTTRPITGTSHRIAISPGDAAIFSWQVE